MEQCSSASSSQPRPSSSGQARLCGPLPWPEHLLQDPAKQPKVVETREQFLEEVVHGEHLDRLVVLREGVEKLGLQDSLPVELRGVAAMLGRLPELAERFKFRVSYRCPKTGKYDELTRCQERFPKELAKLLARDDLDEAAVYVTELRHLQSYRHFSGEKVKTPLLREVKDLLNDRGESDWLPYWDRYDSGLFVSSAGAAMPLHQDQVLWSNVGKNYAGHKLVATWATGDPTIDVLDGPPGLRRRDRDQYLHFDAPLSEAQTQALAAAAQVCLLEPGDCFVFSGGVAHAALAVTPGITAYESFVGLNPRHVELFAKTGDRRLHFTGGMDDEGFSDIEHDVAEDLAKLDGDPRLDDPQHERLSEAYHRTVRLLAQRPSLRRRFRRRGMRAPSPSRSRSPKRGGLRNSNG